MTRVSRKRSKKETRRERLRAAIFPFANVPITEEGDVWLYVGTADEDGALPMQDGTYQKAHLHTKDFHRMRKLL